MTSKYEVRYTFSSEVLLTKHRNASENWEPLEPVRKSATQGHSRAFWVISSTDWKIQNFQLFSFVQPAKLKAKDQSNSIQTSVFWFPYSAASVIIKKNQQNMRFGFSQTFIRTLKAHEKWNTKKEPTRTDSTEVGLEEWWVVVWVSATASALSVWPILNRDFWALNSDSLAFKLWTQFSIVVFSHEKEYFPSNYSLKPTLVTLFFKVTTSYDITCIHFSFDWTCIHFL